MNFQTMGNQRKFILIAAVVGIISVFLPWATVSFGFDVDKIRNGFYNYGIVVFIAFFMAAAVALLGPQILGYGSIRMVSTIAGVIALVFIFLFGLDLFSNPEVKSGLVKVTTAFGVRIASWASIGIMVFAWVFKNTGVKSTLSTLQVVLTPQNISPTADKIGELERLGKLRESGNITEEEFKQLKSKIL